MRRRKWRWINLIWRRGGYGKRLLEGGWSLIGGWKYFKKGGLTRKGWRKNRGGGCDPQRKYAFGDKVSLVINEAFTDSIIAKAHFSKRKKIACIINGTIAPDV